MKRRRHQTRATTRNGYNIGLFAAAISAILIISSHQTISVCQAFHHFPTFSLSNPHHGLSTRIRHRRQSAIITTQKMVPVPHDVMDGDWSFLLHQSTQLLSIAPSSFLPDLSEIFPDAVKNLPFADFSRSLFDELDIGSALATDTKGATIPDEATGMVLESIGQDLLIFLAASVVVTPVSNALGVSSILGYLLVGALLGPHGLDVFANSKADVELGDFGILFLLFSEGLEVSSSRLRRLADFLPLGLAQMSLSAGALSAGIVLVAPALERFLPLDAGLIDISSPAEALVLALAGTLSTSAFVFPVLKEREWEEELSGQAATSILLLQDLAVAPLLVLMPYVVGQGPTDYTAVGFLSAKATIGFGSVIFIGSFILRQLFDLIAKTRSTETFVALCLLVSVGIGEIAKGLGLTDTAGAFAAGVLLANTNYRAQIQADILPFKGILLGIFFMDAGSSFDTDTVLTEFPTVLTGAFALIFFKALTLFLATRVPEWMERNRLPLADAIRLSLLLAGGGEFAFVVLALAERLEVLPSNLGSLLTAIVLITMAVTPFLGQLADIASRPFSEATGGQSVSIEGIPTIETTEIAEDAIVVCGYGEIGESCLRVLYEEYKGIKKYVEEGQKRNLPHLVAFDSDPALAGNILMPSEDAVVLFGDGSNPAVLQSSGITEPSAIFISYQDVSQVSSATARLRSSFPKTPIYARAQSRSEAQLINEMGATEVVIEQDGLPMSATAFIWSSNLLSGTDKATLTEKRLKIAASVASGVPVDITDGLFQIYECVDQDLSGEISAEELANLISKSNAGVHSDSEVAEMEAWIHETVVTPLDIFGFCRFYSRSPPMVRQALEDACLF